MSPHPSKTKGAELMNQSSIRATGPIVEVAFATKHQISHIAVNVQRIIIIFSMILPCHVSKIVQLEWIVQAKEYHLQTNLLLQHKHCLMMLLQLYKDIIFG
ncbi:hypothetical protein CFP56_041624 [Quercus suber]|uniref:Uncharacterized protein n=1 Tax=Quercus suber TaxID=58331 RepID=A0AAW0IVT5_QUESU